MERRLRTPYWRIENDLARGVVRLIRTDVAFRSLEDVELSISEVANALDSLGRANMALLVDLRDGPMRTDTAFEQSMAENRPRILGGITRVAVLVATPLGAMQLARHQRQGALEWTTFNEESAALSHLRARRPSTPRL